jgi:hypothetical protein
MKHIIIDITRRTKKFLLSFFLYYLSAVEEEKERSKNQQAFINIRSNIHNQDF